MVKNLPAHAGAEGDVVSIPGSGRSPGGGNGNPLQYFAQFIKESDTSEHAQAEQLLTLAPHCSLDSPELVYLITEVCTF